MPGGAKDVRLPIVFSVSADPVAAGFVPSFSRPGGHRTGVSLFTLALIGKRPELLKSVLPGANKAMGLEIPLAVLVRADRVIT